MLKHTFVEPSNFLLVQQYLAFQQDLVVDSTEIYYLPKQNSLFKCIQIKIFLRQ